MILTRPKKLYKYLSTAGAQALFSSPNPAVWFRLPHALNDPYDIRPVGSYLDEYGTIGSFCLSETPTSIPMWTHYGSWGEGVVLEFSVNSEFFETYSPKKVRYRRKRPTVRSAAEALTTKSIEWAYEQEWRCLMPLFMAEKYRMTVLYDEQALSVSFPFSALSAVIHGYDSKVSVGEFLSKPEASHVKELVCRTRAWSYGLEITQLDDLSHIFANRSAAIWGRHHKTR